MPIKFQPKFTRQIVPKLRRGGLVVPHNAMPLNSLSSEIVQFASSKPGTAPPTLFRFYYVDYPFPKDLFDDEKMINDGVYQFTVKDAVLGVYDLQAFKNDEFCWSFATTDQTLILAALKIGETFDVKIKRPFRRVLYISRSHFSPGVSDSGYGKFAVHLSNSELRNEWFRITTSYEPESEKTESRLPFFFGFRLFGFRRRDRRPMWMKFLSDAVIFAQNDNWGTGLMHVAFSLESFIDMLLLRAYKPSKFPTAYEDHLLMVGEKRQELYGICHSKLNKNQTNKLYDLLNNKIFTLRNSIAHGRKNSEDITSDEYVQGIKAAVEFIWDFDKPSRPLLVPIMYPDNPSLLIDQVLIKDCGSDAILTKSSPGRGEPIGRIRRIIKLKK